MIILADWTSRAGKWASRLALDKRGVAAVEFALVLPLLISLYFVTMEVSLGIETSKKVGRAGSTVADLVTQQQAVTQSSLEAVMKIGESILQPYNRSEPTIIVTGIAITDETVKVAWSRKLVGGVYSVAEAEDTIITVPEKLMIDGDSFLVRVQSRLAYQPVIAWSADQKSTLGLGAAFSGISMGETYYLRPRMSKKILCDDC